MRCLNLKGRIVIRSKLEFILVNNRRHSAGCTPLSPRNSDSSEFQPAKISALISSRLGFVETGWSSSRLRLRHPTIVPMRESWCHRVSAVDSVAVPLSGPLGNLGEKHWYDLEFEVIESLPYRCPSAAQSPVV